MGRRKGILESVVDQTARAAYKSNPDGCFKILLVFLAVIIIGFIVISVSYGTEQSKADTTDRSSSAQAYILPIAREAVIDKFPSTISVSVIKTVQRGSQQHYTTYGKFKYTKGNRQLEGSFEAVSYYNNGNFSSGSISVYRDNLDF